MTSPATPVIETGPLWTKARLRKHGGQGYDHVLRRIVPELARRGIDPETLEPALHHEPLRQLTRN